MDRKKYQLLLDDYIEHNGVKLYRIEALKPLFVINKIIRPGTKGGYIQSEENLSQHGNCWVENGKVWGNAKVLENGYFGGGELCDNAIVSGNASVYHIAKVSGNAEIFENASITGNVTITDNAKVFGDTIISENAIIKDNAQVKDRAIISGNAIIKDNAQVKDRAIVFGNAIIKDNAEIKDNAGISENAIIGNDNIICENACIGGEAHIDNEIQDLIIGDIASRNYGESIQTTQQVFELVKNKDRKKYQLLLDDYIEHNGVKLYRIEALKPLFVINKIIRPGTKGGYIQSEENLSQHGNCWVENGKVWGNAKVLENGYFGGGELCDNAIVSGNASVYHIAKVSGNAEIFENAEVRSCAQVSGNALIFGNAIITHSAKIKDNAEIFDDAIIGNDNIICENARIGGEVHIGCDFPIDSKPEHEICNFIFGGNGEKIIEENAEILKYIKNLKAQEIIQIS